MVIILGGYRAAAPVKGISLSGASDRDAFPAIPTTIEIDYYYNVGFRLIRLPFYWERLQPTIYGALDPTFLGQINSLIEHATAKGMHVMLNCHCFGGRDVGGTERKVGDQQLPFDAFSDLWSRLATMYANNLSVYFDLMNEPESMPTTGYSNNILFVNYLTGTETLVAAYNHAIASIRAIEANNLVLLEGHGFNNAKTFNTGAWYGTASGVAFSSGIVDSIDNWTVSVHNYPDINHGDEGDAIDATILRTQMVNVIAWAQSNNKRVFVGEFSATSADPNGLAVVTDFINYLKDNRRYVYGWSWWEGRLLASTLSAYNIASDYGGGGDPRLAWL
jgi:endoglucanase